MALVVKDRVKQTTTTTSTGTLTLNGTVESYQTFASALSNGDTTYYAILEPSTYEWEVGLGTWTESTAALARTTILESSNSGSAINLTAGEAEVFITYPAEKAVYLDANGNISIAGTVDGRDISTDGTKLDGIEAGATTDQTASEILTAIKTVDGSGSGLDADLLDGNHSSAFATAAQGTLADSAVQPNDSPTFGNITVTGTVDGRDVATDGSKLDGIEAGADVTDTANVTAAGALMDSEVTNLAQVKAFDSSDYATAAQGSLANSSVQPNDSPTFGSVTVTGTVDGRDIATNIPASLGTAGQVLTVNSGATATEWADASASAAIITVTPSGTTYTLDLSQGTHFDLGAIKEDSTVNVSNIPASGSFNFLFEADYFYQSIITWASDFDWDGGYAPTLKQARKQLFSVYKDAGSSQLNSINTGNFTTDVASAPYVVGSATNSSSNGGAVSVDLTSIADLKEDDLVIAFVAKADAGTSGPGAVNSSGWTQLGENMLASDTEDTAARVYYKFMGATPDTTFAILAVGLTAASQAVICYAIRGADLTTPFDGVTPTFNEVTNTVLADPPSITPSGIERLIVAAGFGASNGAVGTYSSSDLLDFVTEDISDSANTSIGVGSRTQLTSSAYDPAAFTYSETSQGADSCIGFTCVIKSANIS